MRIIEVIGPTGAGKSTLIAKVTNILRGQGLRVAEGNRYAQRACSFGFSCPRVVALLLTHLLTIYHVGQLLLYRRGFASLLARILSSNERPILLRLSILRNLLLRIGTSGFCKCRAKDYDLVLLDEGPIHMIHSLFVTNDTAHIDLSQLREYMKIVAVNSHYLFLRASLPTLVERLLGRGHKRFGSHILGQPEQERVLSTTVHIFDTAAAYLQHNHSVLQVESESNGDPELDTLASLRIRAFAFNSTGAI